jgi:hypothetical protein
MLKVPARRLRTWLPVLGAMLLMPLHSKSVLLAAGGQILLLGWSANQVSRREAALGRTTGATWLLLAVAGLIGLLSFGFWLFKDLPL